MTTVTFLVDAMRRLSFTATDAELEQLRNIEMGDVFEFYDQGKRWTVRILSIRDDNIYNGRVLSQTNDRRCCTWGSLDVALITAGVLMIVVNACL